MTCFSCWQELFVSFSHTSTLPFSLPSLIFSCLPQQHPSIVSPFFLLFTEIFIAIAGTFSLLIFSTSFIIEKGKKFFANVSGNFIIEICFNPPSNDEVTTNIGKEFFTLLNKHFPPSNKYH